MTRSSFSLLACPALLAAALTLPCPAAATTARVLGLGNQGDYLEDQSNVISWYGSLVDYPDLIVLEVGKGRFESERADQGAGLHWRLDEQGRWGTIGAYLLGDPQPDEREQRQERALGIWAREFGPLAAALAFSGTSWMSQSGMSYQEDYRHVFGAGLRWEAAPRVYADLAAELVGTEFSYVSSADSIFSDPGPTSDGFGARARVFWGPSERLAVIPLYEHVADHRATYEGSLKDAADLDSRLNRWGLGLNVLPDPDRLIVLSVEYEDGEVALLGAGNPGAMYDMMWREWAILRGRIGFEARALSWLTVRGAARYVRSEMRRRLHQPADPEAEPPVAPGFAGSSDVDAEVEVDLGLAFHLGRFEADFVFNDNALNNLGGLLTNSENYGAQFTRVSLIYSF